MHAVGGRSTSIFSLESLEFRRLLTGASVSASHVLNIVGTSGGETIFVNRLANGKVSISGVLAQFQPGSGAAQFKTIKIDAGGGNDLITISGNVPYTGATISGGNGNDVLVGGKGNDSVGGGAGNDTVDGGGAGADFLSGDSGFDTANYSARSESLKISLDKKANDGASGGAEKDNVQTEEVISGSGNDSLTGSSGEDFLAAGAGRDTIRGLGGNDKLIGSTGADLIFGNEGDDILQARNQDRDTVNGGSNSDGSPDFDLAAVDSIDQPGLGTLPDEASVTDVEQFLDDDDLNSENSLSPIAGRLANLSESGRLYVFSQPTSRGVVTFTLDDSDDSVLFDNINVNGMPLLAVNVNGVVLTYDPATTTQFTLVLDGGNDLVQASERVRVPLLVRCGTGNDTVVGGARDDSIFGDEGNDRLTGGGRNDVLVGNAGRDTLFGNDGRDILIGGDQIDNLYGERGQDILVGGVTKFDQDDNVLGLILAEWVLDRTLEDRIDHLQKGGGLNGSFTLVAGPSGTVVADKGSNFLNGGYDTDWFFKGDTDTTKQAGMGDVVGKE